MTVITEAFYQNAAAYGLECQERQRQQAEAMERQMNRFVPPDSEPQTEYRGFKIIRRDRREASPKRGLRQGWTEYQVTQAGSGRRILWRSETIAACKSYIDKHVSALLQTGEDR